MTACFLCSTSSRVSEFAQYTFIDHIPGLLAAATVEPPKKEDMMMVWKKEELQLLVTDARATRRDLMARAVTRRGLAVNRL